MYILGSVFASPCRCATLLLPMSNASSAGPSATPGGNPADAHSSPTSCASFARDAEGTLPPPLLRLRAAQPSALQPIVTSEHLAAGRFSIPDTRCYPLPTTLQRSVTLTALCVLRGPCSSSVPRSPRRCPSCTAPLPFCSHTTPTQMKMAAPLVMAQASRLAA